MDLETLRSKAQRAEISGLMRDAYDHSMSELPGSDFAVSLGTEHLSIPLTDLNRRYFETGSALDHYAMLFSKIALNSTIEIDTIQNDDKPASYVIALFHSAEDK